MRTRKDVFAVGGLPSVLGDSENVPMSQKGVKDAFSYWECYYHCLCSFYDSGNQVRIYFTIITWLPGDYQFQDITSVSPAFKVFDRLALFNMSIPITGAFLVKDSDGNYRADPNKIITRLSFDVYSGGNLRIMYIDTQTIITDGYYESYKLVKLGSVNVSETYTNLFKKFSFVKID